MIRRFIRHLFPGPVGAERATDLAVALALALGIALVAGAFWWVL